MLRRTVRLSVRGMVVNSDKVPIGKVTDDFEKKFRSYFVDPMNQRRIATDLLNTPLSDEGRFRVPQKIREEILQSILNNFDSLNATEISNIPRLIRRLPQTMISSETEDALFEKFLASLNEMDSESFEKVLKDITRLHIKNACKDEPIVRLFHALSEKTFSFETRLMILSVTGQVVSIHKLAHPVIRSSLLKVITPIPEERTFEILGSISRLPVFPEAISLLTEFNLPVVLTLDHVLGLLSISGGETILRPHFENFPLNEVVAVIERSVELTRINPNVASLLVNKEGINELVLANPQALPGYLRLLSLVEDGDARVRSVVSVARFPESIDVRSASHVVRAMDKAGVPENVKSKFFDAHIRDKISSMTPSQLKAMVQSSWLADQFSANVDSLNSPEPVAIVLSKNPSSEVAERLLKLLEKHHKDRDVLVKVWNYLTEGGTSFGKDQPEKRRVLKEVTRLVFRQTRVAPVESE
jgi:hypothetical protein